MIALGSFGAALAQEGAAKRDLVKMEGAWQLVRGEEGGEPVSEYVVKNLAVVVKGDELTFKNVAPLTDKASRLTIKLDPSTAPRCIDLKVEAGSLKGTVLEGVYEWEGGELKLCLLFAGGPRNRPLEFETKAGSHRVLLVLKRQGP
jgi:uncharacterized protein (TIGR03067 family)